MLDWLLTKKSETHPVTRGPNAAPKDPIPSIIAPTVALAFWLSLSDLCVPYSRQEISLHKQLFMTTNYSPDHLIQLWWLEHMVH